MNRNPSDPTDPQRPAGSTSSGALAFAEAILGELPAHCANGDGSDGIDWEQLEFLASISSEHERKLRDLARAGQVDAREREQLEWLAAISTDHHRQFQDLLREEAAAAGVRERARRCLGNIERLRETWDEDKHPRLGGPPNAGWFASTGGGAAATSPPKAGALKPDALSHPRGDQGALAQAPATAPRGQRGLSGESRPAANAASPAHAARPKSKAEWVAQARREVHFTEATSLQSYIERNKQITAAYARMYLRDPDKYLWAGMAAYASAAVGEGMRLALDAAKGLAGAVPLNPLFQVAQTGPEHFLQSAPGALKALQEGNIAVFDDIYWQFLAYSSGGIEEMERLNKSNELTDAQLKAWRLIASGKIEEGNLALLRYEQSVTLQKSVYDRYPEIFKSVSDASEWMKRILGASFLNSPIPGDGTSFTAFVPNGNFANFGDRWKWIEKSMLPKWLQRSGQQRSATLKDMNRFVTMAGT